MFELAQHGVTVLNFIKVHVTDKRFCNVMKKLLTRSGKDIHKYPHLIGIRPCLYTTYPVKFKSNFFFFLKPILLPPYLGPYMCRRFHAKFQDSRTNNKKRPPPFNLTQKYM